MNKAIGLSLGVGRGLSSQIFSPSDLLGEKNKNEKEGTITNSFINCGL
jgi:hypothetical protein